MKDDEFLQTAMDTCGDAVYRLALCRLGNRADAEDVYQETFLRLLREDSDFADAEHLKAWLLRVALSRCADLRRSAWFRKTAPLEAAGEAAAPQAGEESGLWQAVQALPEEFRTAVWLHYVEGYRTDEIAGMLGCSQVTVRTRLHRARKQLKMDLEESYHEQKQLG